MELSMKKDAKNLLEKRSPTKRKEKLQSRSRYGKLTNSSTNAQLECLETLSPSDQAITDQEISFIYKLRQCRVLYDFDNPESGLEGKRIKAEILQEIIDHLAQVRGIISITVYHEIIALFSCNLFHTLPPIEIPEAEFKEDVPVEDVAWSHLKLIYQMFRNFLYSPGFIETRDEFFLENKFILEILQLFNSSDKRERIALRYILSGIYYKFNHKRNFIRKEMRNIFLSSIYEGKYCNGIPQLLEVMAGIIMEFDETVNGEYYEFLTKVLLPLHTGEYLILYHAMLVSCLVIYIKKYPFLSEPIIRYILLVWPNTCAEKEIMFLEEIEALLQVINAVQFIGLRGGLFRQILKCVTNPHFQVSKYALRLWNNETVKRLTNEISVLVLPTVITTLYDASKLHWHKQIRESSYFYLKVFLSDNFTTFYKLSYNDLKELWGNLETNLELNEIEKTGFIARVQLSRRILNPAHSVPFEYIDFDSDEFENLLACYIIEQRQRQNKNLRGNMLNQFRIRRTLPGSLCLNISNSDSITFSPEQQHVENLQQPNKQKQQLQNQLQYYQKQPTKQRNPQEDDQKQLQTKIHVQQEHAQERETTKHHELQRQEILRPLPLESGQPPKVESAKEAATTATNTATADTTKTQTKARSSLTKATAGTAKSSATIVRENTKMVTTTVRANTIKAITAREFVTKRAKTNPKAATMTAKATGGVPSLETTSASTSSLAESLTARTSANTKEKMIGAKAAPAAKATTTTIAGRKAIVRKVTSTTYMAKSAGNTTEVSANTTTPTKKNATTTTRLASSSNTVKSKIIASKPRTKATTTTTTATSKTASTAGANKATAKVNTAQQHQK
uniref:Serine/threonine protein phosphatase 2A regulatory subunit n=1 Tax=Glossina austeni TaxID=7395 RepID=A0A1A9UUP5_GLOAU